MKGNKQWSNPKNCTMQGPRPRWFITGTHDPPTSPFLKLHAGTVRYIGFVIFMVHRTVISPVFILYLVCSCMMISLSTVRFSVTRKWHRVVAYKGFPSGDAHMGIWYHPRYMYERTGETFFFSDQLIMSRLETTLLTLCCIPLADSAAATCPLDMHVPSLMPLLLYACSCFFRYWTW